MTELNSAASHIEPGVVRQNGRSYAMAAGILGWTLDAFDFFVLVFVVDSVAETFAVAKSSVILTLGITLALRPVGAILFGMLADRYGRRRPLMGVVAFFSLMEVLSGLSISFPMFVVFRSLYGIGMGGFWGVGAALTMESSQTRRRGLYSGLLQGGYPLGYLVAAIAARFILPVWGWRPMFWSGVLPALVTIYVAFKAPESTSWRQHRVQSFKAIVGGLWSNRGYFVYLVLAVSLMVCLAHGTQDLYPDFLKTAHHFAPNLVANLAIIYSVGGIFGTIVGGNLSERWGRRRTMIAAFTLCILIIPVWSFGRSATVLTIAAIVMQIGVQAAWGVMPAHLNELSPDAVRSLFAGFVYQLGVLFASPTNTIEYALRGVVGYGWALSLFEGFALIALITLFALGPEKKGRSFLRDETEFDNQSSATEQPASVTS